MLILVCTCVYMCVCLDGAEGQGKFWNKAQYKSNYLSQKKKS